MKLLFQFGWLGIAAALLTVSYCAACRRTSAQGKGNIKPKLIAFPARPVSRMLGRLGYRVVRLKDDALELPIAVLALATRVRRTPWMESENDVVNGGK